MKKKIQIGPQISTKEPIPHAYLIVVAILSFIAGLQAATQRFAADVRYHPNLGANLHRAQADPQELRTDPGSGADAEPDRRAAGEL